MELRGRTVLVVGLGLSGLAAARLLLREGAQVRATDLRQADQLGPEANGLREKGVELFLGSHPTAALKGVDLIVVSPGVPLDIPPLVAARSNGAEIIGEMGLAATLLNLPMVAVSGTNGKSTTTALIAHLLEASGKKVFLGGNIGRPLTECLLGQAKDEVAVIEVSSFQLESMPFFKPRVAVMLNIAPDHLDRHPDFQAYARIKARLWADLGPEDALILNGQDSLMRSLAEDCPARQYFFGSHSPAGAGAWPQGSAVALREADGREVLVEAGGFRLPGGHNAQNLQASLLAAWQAGADPETMPGALATFKALPHRLEWVRNKDGVDYFNDSKATNAAAAREAVLGFDRPIILIAGGLDKGTGYAELAEAAKGRVKMALLIGQAADLMAEALSGICPVEKAGGLKEAVSLAHDLARPGDVVLLSPACASFDQFDNYGHRGRVFSQAVEGL